jgi:chromatin remodeling complex protein RSC6
MPTHSPAVYYLYRYINPISFVNNFLNPQNPAEVRCNLSVSLHFGNFILFL